MQDRSRGAVGVVTRRRSAAFSLLELVIALSIVAVMAAYAVPAYVRHMARGHRMSAVTALYQAAQFLEANPKPRIGKGREWLPAGFDQAPSDGAAVYRLRAVPGAVENGGYVIEAQPVESGPMRGDSCGVFVLDATGKRSNRTADARMPRDIDCWSAR